jgi:hypothetical protein
MVRILSPNVQTFVNGALGGINKLEAETNKAALAPVCSHGGSDESQGKEREERHGGCKSYENLKIF